MFDLIFFETRKNFARWYIFTVLFAFMIINIFLIYGNYKSGDGPNGYFLPHSEYTKSRWDFYKNMHEKVDGPLTLDKVRFIIDENKRLENITQDGTFSKEYQKDSYTGYIWGDYTMINTYFYKPIKYVSMYETNIKSVVKKAEENINFYKKYGNNYEVKKNEFIKEHYNSRKIDVFYDGKQWEKLYKYNFSDLLILFLMFLGLVPIYVNEKETKMNGLILSSKNGNFNLKFAKLISAFIYIFELVLIFSFLNFLEFKLLYGLSGGGMPLYAIEMYKYTQLKCSVQLFYIYIVLFKLVGFFAFGLFLCLLSVLFNHVLYPYVIGFTIMVAGIYASGYYASEEFWKTILAILSPFTMLKGNELFVKIYDINFADFFFLRQNLCLLIQIIIIKVLFIFIYILCSKGRLNRKKVVFIRKGGYDVIS